MSMEAVEKVVNDDILLKLFHIHENLWPAIRKGWQRKKGDLLGRFDFSWNGVDPPKMLEYNADTPSLLLESSTLQEKWFRDTQKAN